MNFRLLSLIGLLFISMNVQAQEVVKIKIDAEPDVKWEHPETSYFNEVWETQTVGNVSEPTMEVFRPENPNGTSVVICPGGALYLHSIESEGNLVAKWLNEKGVTAFVLKYRLVPTALNGNETLDADGPKVEEKASYMLRFAHRDALNAIYHIRENANQYDIDPGKIGLMGFSAGGAVTMDATYRSDKSNRPDFIAPVYAWMNVVEASEVPSYGPPAFIVCASDDPLDLAPASVQIYSDWLAAKYPVELHMYAKGGHGFGMRGQDLPTDQWINRFGEWLGMMGYLD